MEFRIDFKSYGNDGTALFVTRWLDSGEGIDAFGDVKWQSRQSHSFWEEHPQHSRSEELYPPRSICGTFEGRKCEDFVFDGALSRENEHALRRVMKRQWPGEKVKLKELKRYFDVRDGRLVLKEISFNESVKKIRYDGDDTDLMR
jgi:hypothetical protein